MMNKAYTVTETETETKQKTREKKTLFINTKGRNGFAQSGDVNLIRIKMCSRTYHAILLVPNMEVQCHFHYK